MATKDIIVVGASAGGVDALMRLCGALPDDLPAAIFIAQHLSPSSKLLLPMLLDRAGALPVVSPEDGEGFRHGHVYVAAPDHHLLLRDDHMLMRRGPLENRARPSINALFCSAAVAHGGRVIGVVLTGLLDDGSDGMVAIKAAGGTALVQDPADAQWPSMPRNALNRDHVDYVLPLDAIPAALDRLCREEANLSIPLPPEYAIEDRIAAEDFAVADPRIRTPGQPSVLACPDCGGVLNQIEVGDELHFRCQIGHAFTPLGLAQAQGEELERALAIAVRTHRDRMRLLTRMSDNAEDRGLVHAGARWREAVAESGRMIELLEQVAAGLSKAPGEVQG